MVQINSTITQGANEIGKVKVEDFYLLTTDNKSALIAIPLIYATTAENSSLSITDDIKVVSADRILEAWNRFKRDLDNL